MQAPVVFQFGAPGTDSPAATARQPAITSEDDIEVLTKSFDAACDLATENLGDPWLNEPGLKQNIIETPQDYATHHVPLIRKVAEASARLLRAQEKKRRLEAEAQRNVSLAEARALVATARAEVKQEVMLQLTSANEQIDELKASVSEGKLTVVRLSTDIEQLKAQLKQMGSFAARIEQLELRDVQSRHLFLGFLPDAYLDTQQQRKEQPHCKTTRLVTKIVIS
jgi:hypothetical protein